jgi:hypothetical protein
VPVVISSKRFCTHLCEPLEKGEDWEPGPNDQITEHLSVALVKGI